METELPSFSDRRILVVGDVMLDRYWDGATSRISPEAPVPVVRVGDRHERPGGAGNVALNLVALGANVTLMGAIGDDTAGDVLQSCLLAAGIQLKLQRLSAAATITKLRVMSRDQQLIRLDFEDGALPIDTEQLLQDYAQQLEYADAVILSDYGKGTLIHCQRLIELANAKQIPILVDPKHTDFSHYCGATVVTPNRSEFEAAVGECRSEAVLVEKGQALMSAHALAALLITRGKQGMTLLVREQAAVSVSAITREVYDVTGAGDTVIALLTLSLAAGKSFTEAIHIANAGASVTVTKLGAATVSVAELRRALKTEATHNKHLATLTDAVAIADAARQVGKRIVMTNGCFDILHVGHIHYLQQAKALGDVLIVAVNDDASVARLKGSSRPINALHARMTMLAALAAVDWVVAFTEDTPKQLICAVLPDILVKGGDYTIEQIAGADCVLQQGGEVKILDFVPGFSTTRLLEKLTEVST